jgi:DNA polymerase elongation subunit (family B)
MVLSQDNIKTFSCHLKTMGAYVQQPNPAIVGLSDFQVIGSQDARSLYPTIMILCNIGYETLYARLYDTNIVGKMIGYIKHSFNDKKNVDPAVAGFKNALQILVKNYTNRNDILKKKEFQEFTVDYYCKLFKTIISYPGKIEDIFSPKDDETYFLLKSCLFPILEAITWLHENNRGYNATCIDWVFYNSGFANKYKGQTFYVFEHINSVKTKLVEYSIDTISSLLNTYLVNPYGTLFYRHNDKKSFEVDLIIKGMGDRGFIKDQGLILKAIKSKWNSVPESLKRGLSIAGHIDETVANDLVSLVGDSDEKMRVKQLNNLLSIIMGTDGINDLDILAKKIEVIISQKNNASNGVKTTLNTGYGIYAMTIWEYGNALIANSITNAGKIYGIKLFQQIASNILTEEQNNISKTVGNVA